MWLDRFISVLSWVFFAKKIKNFSGFSTGSYCSLKEIGYHAQQNRIKESKKYVLLFTTSLLLCWKST